MNGASQIARLHRRLAIVTGAGQGIGLAIAHRLAAEGAVVVGADLSVPSSTKSLLLSTGAIAPWHLDVTAEASWRALVDALAGKRPAILVNNAGGVLERSLIHECSRESWDRTIALNLTSVFLGMRCILPLMLDGGTGAIVNMCSISGFAATQMRRHTRRRRAGSARSPRLRQSPTG